MYALLLPDGRMKKLQDEGRFTELMVLQEEVKDLPFGAVWHEYLERVGVKADYLSCVKVYEKEVLNKR